MGYVLVLKGKNVFYKQNKFKLNRFEFYITCFFLMVFVPKSIVIGFFDQIIQIDSIIRIFEIFKTNIQETNFSIKK